jgi:hypothetical protein
LINRQDVFLSQFSMHKSDDWKVENPGGVQPAISKKLERLPPFWRSFPVY